MGCGGSKFDTEGDTVPVKFQPLLRRGFEEIRRRRNTIGLKNPTPSKKELLGNENDEDEDDDSNSHPPNSIDSIEKVIIMNRRDYAIDHQFEKAKCNKAGDEGNNKSEEMKCRAKSHVDEDGDEGGDEYDDEEGRNICPGSPSFRVYYVESLGNEKDDDHNGDNEGITIQSLAGNQGIAAMILAEGSVTHTRKKGMKGRQIRRVINKGGHVAVKNFRNVTSCYNPSSSAHRNTHLLPQPAA